MVDFQKLLDTNDSKGFFMAVKNDAIFYDFSYASDNYFDKNFYEYLSEDVKLYFKKEHITYKVKKLKGKKNVYDYYFSCNLSDNKIMNLKINTSDDESYLYKFIDFQDFSNRQEEEIYFRIELEKYIEIETKFIEKNLDRFIQSIKKTNNEYDFSQFKLEDVKSEILKKFLLENYPETHLKSIDVSIENYNTTLIQIDANRLILKYNNLIVNIKDIGSMSIINYIKKNHPEIYLDSNIVTIEDIDTNKIRISGESKIQYNNRIIHINDIISPSIKKFLLKKYPELYISTKNIEIDDLDFNKIIIIKNKRLRYNNLDISIENIVEPSIIKFLLEKYPEVYLDSNIITIENIDINKIKIDESNFVVRYNNQQINIKDIKSRSIREYILSKLSIKTKMNYVLKNTPIVENICLPDVFNYIDKHNKLEILKYIFIKLNSNIKHINVNLDDFITDLLYHSIIINKYENALYLLKNKKILLNESEYEKLLNKTIEFKLYDFNSLLLEYKFLDYMSNICI
jgi:hypothetical protein